IDGKVIVERLEAVDDSQRSTRYSMVSGIPATRYEGTLGVQPKGNGSTVTWQVNYRPEGQGELIVRTIISTLLTVGLDSLKARFGSSP
ncbi:SRPBCC family protein, partial [Aestuariivirga sp.]|uniref:SRPBCC family protein n=1 Tax=Aestuariivirga sp. TaxID=2650926 RepID=UPI003019693D